MTTTSLLSTTEAGSAAQRERRRRILAATFDLAASGGYDAVQMREVADRAGVALGTLYRYFPSKIHLLVATLDAKLAEMEHRVIAEPLAPGSPDDRVVELFRRIAAGPSGSPDRNLVEAVTRAYMFADANAAGELDVIADRLCGLILDATGVGGSAAEHLFVITDVWLSVLMAWVNGRASEAEMDQRIRSTVRLVTR